jgi:hypothetical protein
VLVQYFAGSAYITVQYINSAETRDMGMGPRTGTHWPAALLPRLAARLANDRPATAANSRFSSSSHASQLGRGTFYSYCKTSYFRQGLCCSPACHQRHHRPAFLFNLMSHDTEQTPSAAQRSIVSELRISESEPAAHL